MKKNTLLIIIIICFFVFPFSLLLGFFTTGVASRSPFLRYIHPNHYYYSYYSSRPGRTIGGSYRGGGPGIGK